jgi:hypothetical protein
MTEASDHIWGAKQISLESGLSVDLVYKSVSNPAIPIYKPPGSGRVYASRTELRCWLRTKPQLPQQIQNLHQ